MATSASPYPSPASSSISLTFPRSSSPTKDSLRSNPHPYAIKTTSTGILTRSNSTHSSNSTSHHFVPSSPTKPKVNSPRPSGHKYSRSLNAELPRPLPIPPNFPSSASPTRAEFDIQDVPVLTRRERRADTLPSASQPNLVGGIGTDELPDDPRVWTPSQLAAYLTSSLRVTSGDLPPLVAQDIATFVRTQKINGRKFLRLTEGDLDKYGLNQRWQSALLGASRVLRQDSLRGRIWNPAFPSDQQGEQEDETGNYSSTSSMSSNSMSGSQRGRSGTGRVKGMVASFERNGPSRSVSPVKDSGRGASPVKRMDDLKGSLDSEVDSAPAINSTRSRPRPQSDSFPFRTSYSMASAPETTTAPTMGMDGDTERKKEPRLLPYPPSSQQILSEHASFNASLQHNLAQGIPAFGPPYGSPQILSQDVSFGPLPPGVLPFSPQSTGSIASPEPLNHMNPMTTGGSYIQTQGFDTLYVNALVEGVRPLPLPPHPGQLYQPPASIQGYGGDMMTDVNYVSDNGVYAPHGKQQVLSVGATTAPVPHVQVQRVSEPSHAQAPVNVVDSQQPQRQQHYQQEQQQQQHQPVQILAPQPRHGGRESPTKLLEEKLEELLEPRPRSRVFPGQPGSGASPSHSRIPSKSYSPTPSRPRSRVPSMNLAAANGSVRSKTRVPSSTNLSANGLNEKKSNGSIDGADGGSGGLLGVGNGGAIQHPRTRVISLSSRTHSHRLSGVEVWGENHRHIVVPPDEEEGAHRNAEDAIVKEYEAEEEVGIEALLEKEAPVLPIPVPLSVPKDDVKEGSGHGKEASAGSVGGGSVAHSRAGSLREPKSAVITVVERKSSWLRKDELGEKVDAEVEESMEALLAKADLAALNVGSRRKKGGKKRAAVSGVEAWEMEGVDTVKHVDGDGMSRSVEDIFSPVLKLELPPRSQSSTVAQGQTSRLSPSPQTKAKLKPKERRKSGETERLDELEKREDELERSVGETRRMVEEVRGRLEKVEHWIAERERQIEVEGERRRNAGVGMGAWPVDLVRRVLSASRVPGMLGLSAWFGTTSTSSAPSSSSSSPSMPAATSSQNQTAQTKAQRQSLMQRFARMTLTMSTYAVLFGIGVCVVMLRVLGRKVGLAAKFGGAAMRMGNGVLKR